MAQLALHILKKLDTVHHTALLFCSGAFQAFLVVSLYVDCVEPSLYLIHEQLSLELYFHILSHSPHPLRTYPLTKECDILYENWPSYIQNFGIRIIKLFSCSSLSDRVCMPANSTEFSRRLLDFDYFS